MQFRLMLFFLLLAALFVTFNSTAQPVGIVADASKTSLFTVNTATGIVTDTVKPITIHSVFLDEFSSVNQVFATVNTSSTGRTGAVLRFNLDGSDLDTILYQDKVKGVCYDYLNSMLYFIESSTHKVGRISILGTLPLNLSNAEYLDAPAGAAEPSDIEFKFIGANAIVYVSFNDNSSGDFADEGVYMTSAFSRTSVGALSNASWTQLVYGEQYRHDFRCIALDVTRDELYFSERKVGQIYQISTSSTTGVFVSSLAGFLPSPEKVIAIDLDLANSKLYFINSEFDVLKVADLGSSASSVMVLTQSGVLGRPSSLELLARNPLPVTWSHFSAEHRNNSVVLNWKTASEVNNKEFLIQRSTDDISFTTISNKSGSGTSVLGNDYEFIDDNPFEGTSYYRLVQMDFDGTQSYSEVQSVFIEGSQSDVMLYPNPVRKYGEFTVRVSGSNSATKALISISNPHGLIIYEKHHVLPGNLVIDVSDVFESAGMYILHYKAHKTLLCRTFVVQ